MSTDELRVVVGANIRRRRIECQFSQRALGDAVGISGAQINRIEKGHTSLPVDLLARLSEVMKWEPASFLIPSGVETAKENYAASA